MKRMPILSVHAVLFASLVYAGVSEQVVTITPQKPVPGRSITVRYDPTAKGATLFAAEDIDVEVLLLRVKETPLLLESPMKRIGKLWRARIKLDDPNAVMGIVQFVSGNSVDNNENHYWDFLVHDHHRRPMKGAHLARSRSYQYPSSPLLRREKNLSLARQEALKEESLFPNQRETKFRLWEIDLAEKGRDSTFVQEVEEQLDVMTMNYQDDEDILGQVASWYKRVGLTEKSNALKDQLIEKDPTSNLAEQIYLERIYEIKDRDDRAERALEFLEKFPETSSSRKFSVIRILMRAKRYDDTQEIITSMDSLNGMMLNGIAWTYIDQEINLERGAELAELGVAVLRNPDPESRPSYYSERMWEKSNRMNLGFTLDTYAFGLFKLGRYHDAEDAYGEAYDLTQGLNSNINERLVQCYLKSENYDAAIEVTKESIENMKYTGKLLEYGKVAFEKKEGSALEFDRLVEAAKGRGMERAREEILVKRIDKPAPDFTAKNVGGEIIQLSELKGKIVVLDFWATWCGPCKAAFPFVQKVYEKYKDNPDVVILAVNTWEKETGAKREKRVEKFIEKNQYTFPVVFDESKIVEKYKVEGVPTQFYIDRGGMIRFKEVGFAGPALEFSMSLMIDMLLSGELLSVK